MPLTNHIKLILPEIDVTLQQWDKVDAICKPLKKFGITFFNYLRVHHNGKIFDLNNAPEMTEFFYYKSNLYSSFLPIIKHSTFDSGFIMDTSVQNDNFFEIMRDSFNIDNVIFFIKKKSNWVEFWQFGTQPGNHKIINFYLNNTELLKKFVEYFRKEHQDLLKLASTNCYQITTITQNQDCLYPYDPEEINFVLNQLNECNQERKFLTQREMECLKLCASGKTAKEIGLILRISSRTVEIHLNHIKEKLNCTKNTQILLAAIDAGYL